MPNLNTIPTWFEEICLGAGTVAAIWIPLLTIHHKDKKDKKREAKVEAEKLVLEKKRLEEVKEAEKAEITEIKKNIGWLMKQFGKNPNGGGIMEQVKEHIAYTKAEFTEVREGQKVTDEKVDQNITITTTTAARLQDHLNLVEQGIIK